MAGAMTDQVVGVRSKYDGSWFGTTVTTGSGNRTLRFDVKYGSIVLIMVLDVPTPCGTTTNFSQTASTAIVNDQVSVPFANTLNALNVSFTSATTASGTHGTISLGSILCPSGERPFVSVTGGTFTSTKAP